MASGDVTLVGWEMKGLILSGSRVVNSDEGEDEDEEKEQAISNWRVPLCPPVLYVGTTWLGGGVLLKV